MRFRYSIKNVPVLIALLFLAVLTQRAGALHRLLTDFTVERKPRDLLMVLNGVKFIDRPPVVGDRDVQAAIKKIVKGAHRNTVFFLGEDPRNPAFTIQPDKAFTAEEVAIAKKEWINPKNHGKIYGPHGMRVEEKTGYYHLIATTFQLRVGKRLATYELLAFTSITRTIHNALYSALIELAILLGSAGVVIFIPVWAIAKAQQDKTKAIAQGLKCEPKGWWPQETRIGGEAYNALLDAQKVANDGLRSQAVELEKAVTKAEALARETENITHIFAHDLKAGQVASAKAGEYVTETARELLEYLQQAEHADKSVERSLNFIIKYSARITASCQNDYALIDQRNKLHNLAERMTPEPHAIQEVFDGVGVAFTRSDGVLAFVDETPPGTMAMIDIALFLSAIKNLVKNAFAYNEAIAKKVEIKAILNDRKIQFSVCDNGIGFPPEYVQTWGHIQGQAARLDTTREGSGTGLYSVRRIIEAHEGASVSLESERGVGSTFLITVGMG